MTEERLKLHEKAETRINAIIDTLSQDKGGLADKLRREDVKDFLVSLWVDCETEATKELQKENKDIQRSCENYYNEMRSYKNKMADLEAQIEKMKCCSNCQTVRDAEGNCYFKKDGKCKKKDKWELRR